VENYCTNSTDITKPYWIWIGVSSKIKLTIINLLTQIADEDLLVSCSRDRLVNVWDRKARSLVHTFQGINNECDTNAITYAH
jgi:WD40 repeat protein